MHTHTSVSDGDSTPYELIDLVAEQGGNYAFFTDHHSIFDDLDGLNQYASEKNIQIVVGTEIKMDISSLLDTWNPEWRNLRKEGQKFSTTMEFIVYKVDPDSPQTSDFKEMSKKHLGLREENVKKLVMLLMEPS